MVSPVQTSPAKPSWGEAFRIYLQPIMLAMLFLGFASGLPYMMVFQKMSFWLRSEGIERSTIGFFYWVTFFYSFKFFWAPFVDKIKLPGLTRTLGQRRSWMLLGIVGTIVGMLICGASDPSESLWLTVSGALVIAFFGATLDISIDAWRIESAPNSEQAQMAAVYTLGYRFAIIASGISMAVAGWISWPVAFVVLAGLMSLNILTVLFFVREPEHRETKPARSLGEAVQEYIVMPFGSFVQRLGRWIVPVLLVVCFYRVSDFTMGVMAYPLYSDLGFTEAQVGLTSSFWGVWITILGAMVGGLVVVKIGMMRSLLIGAVITVITTALFAWLAVQPEPLLRDLFVTIAADNIAGGFAGTVFIAYLSSLVDKRYTATQYAFLSSIYAFFLKFMSGFSGVIVDAIDYPRFFFLTASYTVPVALVVLFIMWRGPALARGIADEESPTAESEPDSTPAPASG